MGKLKVRRIEITGKLRPGVTAKDVTLYVINRLGVNGGVGYAYEYAGEVIERMSMDERMTVCNMAIEGGARLRLHQPGRNDLRIPTRKEVRSRWRSVGKSCHVLEECQQ